MWVNGASYESYIGRWSRLVAGQFLNWLDVSSGAQWLDVGCGTGILSQTILDIASPKIVVGVEPSEEYIEFARKHIQDLRVSFRLGDAQMLPVESASYDAAVSGLVVSANETRFDKEEIMISRSLSCYFMIIIVISSFPVLSTLQIAQRARAQAPLEGAKVLVDDVIQDLKSNDSSKAQVHLNILNQQLPTFVNSSSLESVKVLLDDVTSALKNNDMNNAIIHLNLVKQQLIPNTSTQVTKVQTNHPPTADNLTITVRF